MNSYESQANVRVCYWQRIISYRVNYIRTMASYNEFKQLRFSPSTSKDPKQHQRNKSGISVAPEMPTTNWPTWHCQEACSRTVLMRPETLDRLRLTVWTAESADGSIRQSGVLVDQARRRQALANWGSVVRLHGGLCMSEQPSCTVSVLGPATSKDW